jgi:hypothetical protein
LGTVTLLNSIVTTNSASGGTGGNGGNGANTTASLARGGNGGNGAAGGAAFGGAIYHAGDFLLISNCTFSGNSVLGGNAGTGGAFGTGFSPGLEGSGGAGAQGSGAVVYNTNAFLERTFIDEETNVVTTNFVIFSTNIIVVQSTFSDNSAQGGNSAAGGTASSGQGVSGARGGDSLGGALFLSAGAVTNCTFYNDKSSGGSGGNGGTGTANLSHGGNGGNGGNATGAALYHSVQPAELNVVSCTISNCSAFGGTNGLAGQGPFAGNAGTKGLSHGTVANGTGTFNLQNTILATNLSGQASFGTVIDAGYNITFGTTFTLKSGLGSFKTNNVKLGPLKNNGGLTATMELLASSPAIDKIPPNQTNDALNPFPKVDQRGFFRPINTNADIGAFELASASAPIITQEPTNAVTMLGSNATFYVVAVGAPILQYQWYLADGTKITNATRSSFTVTNATPTNAGPYYVNVHNNFGSTNSSEASVVFSPSITSQPANQTVAPGGAAVFMVTAIGDAPLFYQWLFQGTSLPGKTASLLTVPDVHQAQVGNYQVIVSNAFGSVTSAPAALNLLPGINTQPTNITAATGSTVIFAVVAEGSTPLAYQWQKNGTNVSLNGNSSAYFIGNVQPGDAGAYNVVITNGFGSVNSATGILTVVQGPVISVQPSQVIVPTNSDATFTVTAVGAPPLTYQWRFNNSNLAGQTTTALLLHNVQPANAGSYAVVVTNPVGAVTSSPALLKLIAGPLSITTPTAVSNKLNLLFLSQTGFTYVVEYKTNLSSPAWTLLLSTNGTGNPVLIQDSTTNSSSRFYRVRVQ